MEWNLCSLNIACQWIPEQSSSLIICIAGHILIQKVICSQSKHNG
jgi:hypothetical protein